jgi:hypothetical protein
MSILSLINADSQWEVWIAPEAGHPLEGMNHSSSQCLGTGETKEAACAVAILELELRLIELRQTYFDGTNQKTACTGIPAVKYAQGWRCTRAKGHRGPCAAIQLLKEYSE